MKIFEFDSYSFYLVAKGQAAEMHPAMREYLRILG